MGAPDNCPTREPIKSMQFSLIASLAFIAIATAAPTSDIVPEDTHFAVDDDLSEARETLSQMQSAGRSDKDCRKLVEESKKEITTNVGTCQKIINSLPDGSQCINLGQDLVTKTTESKKKADNHVIHCKTEITKCESYQVDFGSRTYSSLTVGKCSSFYTSTQYVSAKARYTAAVTAHTKAIGAAGEAATALKNAITAASNAKNTCLCKTGTDHSNTYTKCTASNGANTKQWTFAHHLECVLDKKTNCVVPKPPTNTRGKVISAVKEASCVTPKRL